jgi:hypothetical protein
MKRVMILSIMLSLNFALFAQKKTSDPKMAMKGCVMMKDGKMMMAKSGDTTAMEKDMKMSNGTMVMTDGMCKMKNGKTMKMTDGDCMCMDGKMMKKKTTKPMQHKM